jgi:hypothetical protein
MPHSPCSFVLLFEYQTWHVVTALQVCEALAAQYAATSSQSPPEPPKEYLCPISQQIMINPVLLVETGDSYEAANITRWLDTHSTCPLTGQQLQSKQLSSNRALKNRIADWAAAHGFVLPAAPTYTPVLSGSISPATTAAAAAAPPSMPPTVLSLPHLGGNRRSRRNIFRCSCIRWAVAALALLVVLGVVIGVGVGVASKRTKGKTCQQGYRSCDRVWRGIITCIPARGGCSACQLSSQGSFCF